MSPDLKAIKARAGKATPGPWATGDRWKDGVLHPWEVVLSGSLPVIEMDDTEQGRANAEFIAHAREDIPALLAEVERLRAALAYAQDRPWQNGGA